VRIGVTRKSEQLSSLQAEAATKGIDVIPLPVTTSRPVAFRWPEGLDSGRIDWLFFTSANGVRFFFEGINGFEIMLGSNVKIGVVGSRTAMALTPYGFKPNFVPQGTHGKALFEEFIQSVAVEGESVVYARARQTNYNPAGLLKRANLGYWSLVCYETTPLPVEPKLVQEFSRDDYILFTAPSAVQSYQVQFGRPMARPVAIGRTTASAMNHCGWLGFITMKKADISNILELVPWS
jgi:uroporphyrinogen-III synthase